MTEMDVASVLASSLGRIQQELTALRKDVQHLDGTHEELHELDERADSSELRHDITEKTLKELSATVERLVNGTTARDLYVTASWEQAQALLLEIRAAVLAGKGQRADVPWDTEPTP